MTATPHPVRTAGLIVLVLILLTAAGGYGLLELTRSRTFQLAGEIVPHIDTTEKVVALTFDDGPTPYADGVLDLLKQNGVKATFFVIGSDVARNMDIARRIVADGHEIGNHSYTHPRMVFVSDALVKSEIEKTDAVLRDAGASGEILFRPPNGKKLYALPKYLAAHDRPTITWDVEPESYDDIAADAGKMTQYVLDQTKPGSIVLLHPMYKSRETTRQALPAIVQGLQAKGYRFVTVSELLELDASRSRGPAR